MKELSTTDSKTNANQTPVQKKAEQGSFFKAKESENNFFDKGASPSHILEATPLQRKKNEHLPTDLQSNMEGAFGHDFSGVTIQRESAEATGLNARAFTQGEAIHFAPGEFNPDTEGGKNLIGHEFTHVVQQRNGVVTPTSVMGKGLYLNDDKRLEREADNLGQKAVKGENISMYRSAGLEVRNSLRAPIQAKSDVIQRDIKGDKDLANGKMELDFTKNDAATAGAQASETGTVTFTPNATAPNSNNIRLIQIVRTTDVGGATAKAGEPEDWSKINAGEEANRNKMMTTHNNDKNIAGGFYVDHLAASATPRTSKADGPVSPFYRDYAPNATVSQDGYKKSKADIQPASLWDGPGMNFPTKFNFVTSAKGSNGLWYGSALWGFEIYRDKGIAKIKNEYKSFRNFEGETVDNALAKFNEFYKNPGTAGAPTK